MRHPSSCRARWLEIAGRHFDRPRCVFVVRDALGYARSMYRELMKSGRASLHYDVIKDELARLLGEQQRSIAFFGHWDEAQVALLSFKELAAERLVETLVKRMVDYDVDAVISMYRNSSAKKARNIGRCQPEGLAGGRRRLAVGSDDNSTVIIPFAAHAVLPVATYWRLH